MINEMSPRTAEIDVKSSDIIITTAIVINAIINVLALLFICNLY
jgi:hypothetical protein